MTEREDTIERIERVLKMTHKKSITVTIPRLTAELAVSMLKAQEPRVMTLEEVQKTSTESIDGVVWLESRMHSDPDNGDCDIWFSGWANPVEACETDIHIYAFGNEVPVEAKKRMYGITWRCWTSRPTDEQREKVKWE